MTDLTTEMKDQTKYRMLFWRWLGAMILIYSVVELFFMDHNHVPVKAYLLALGTTTVLVGHILYPQNALTVIPSVFRPSLWSTLLAGGVLLLLLVRLPNYSDFWQLAQLSFGVFVLSHVLCSSTQIACLFIREKNLASSTTLIFFALLSATPLWAGPFADRLVDSQTVTNTLISISPLSYLAVLTDYDYLRSNWFYTHTPFGDLRYTYVSTLTQTTFYVLLCTALPFFRKVRQWQARHGIKLTSNKVNC